MEWCGQVLKIILLIVGLHQIWRLRLSLLVIEHNCENVRMALLMGKSLGGKRREDWEMLSIESQFYEEFHSVWGFLIPLQNHGL